MRGVVETSLATMLGLCLSAALGRATPVLEPFGLDGKRVTSLGFFGRLYAGTIDDGVFRRDLVDPQGTWVSLGLQGKRIRAVYPHPFGPVGFATSVGLEGDPLHSDSALVYCSPMDMLPWVESDSGITRTGVTAIWSLDGFPSPAVCGETFATSIGPMGGVWRRAFGAAHWENVVDVGFGVGNVVRVDPVSGNVWAGGENAVLSPWIARSTDGGNTWHIVYPDLAGDNACNAIVVHPDSADVAFAGMEGSVIRTGDGGVTWNATGLGGTQAYIYGIAMDAASPNHILAGGTITNPNSWALWESFDAGLTWAEVAPPVVQAGVVASGIATLMADPVRTGTFYIATNGHGVWRYRSPPTSVGPLPLPANLALRPNYPNPFNAHTTLAFEVPQALGGARVRLVIHNVRGDLLQVLVDGNLPAGPHRAIWDGRDASRTAMSSGVYYVRLHAGADRRTRAIVLLK